MKRLRGRSALLIGCMCLTAVYALFLPPVAASVPFSSGIVHIVAPGDTLYAIGKMYDIRPPVIAKANQIRLRQALRPGQRLVIPCPKKSVRSMTGHVVAPGETLSAISNRYGVSVSAISEANCMRQRQTLLVGERLVIPRVHEPVFREKRNYIEPEERPVIPRLRADQHRGSAVTLPHSSKWRNVIIHHSATERGSAFVFLRAHLRRGFGDLGYHFVINNGTLGKHDGQIETSRRWLRQDDGAHCKAGGMNFNGIGICIVGNFSKGCVSAKQMDSLVYLIRKLCARYGIPYTRVIGHRHARGARTQCPGNHFPWKELRRRLRSAS